MIAPCPPDAERFADKIIAIEDEIAKPPVTIAHGDLRYDNLYFGANGMAVADWQIVLRARGPYDVAYFMSQSVNPAERRASLTSGVLKQLLQGSDVTWGESRTVPLKGLSGEHEIWAVKWNP